MFDLCVTSKGRKKMQTLAVQTCRDVGAGVTADLAHVLQLLHNAAQILTDPTPQLLHSLQAGVQTLQATRRS